MPMIDDYWVDYSQSYWKALALREKVEKGEIKIHKNYIDVVVDLLHQIQKAAWTQPWIGRKCGDCGKQLTKEDFMASQGWHCKDCFAKAFKGEV